MLISGIFKNNRTHSSYQFDYVVHIEQFKDENQWVLNWGNNGPPTFVLLREVCDYRIVSEKIKNFVAGKDEDDSNVTLFLTPYSDRYLYGSYTNSIQDGGRIEYVRLFSSIAIFILIIACINFMNLSTARASRRAREIGIKKAIGANRSSLIWQHLGESNIITLISLMLAVLFVALFLPEFNEITSEHISIEFTPKLLLTIICITLFTGIIPGSYPALYLSSIQAVLVLKGELKGSIGELWARRGLVVFQFALSVMLIVSVIVVYKQVDYVQNKNLGYNNDNLFKFQIEGTLEENTETFINEVKNISGVKAASSVGHSLIGQNSNTSGLSWPGKNPEERILFENVRANYDVIETLGIDMAQGRSFSREFSTFCQDHH